MSPDQVVECQPAEPPAEKAVVTEYGIRPEEVNRTGRPSPGRFASVVSGAAQWTLEERAVIDADPELQDYERRVREVWFMEPGTR